MGYAKLIKNYSPIVSTVSPGLAPIIPASAATATDVNKPFLRADGTWAKPIGATYGAVSTTAAGLAPMIPTSAATTAHFLNGSGDWSTIPPTKNPNALTLNRYNGNSSPSPTIYDGSSATSIDVAGANAFVSFSTVEDYDYLVLNRANGSTFALPNASTARSGGLKKLDNNSSHYLNGTGGWTKPVGTTYAIATTDAPGLMSAADKNNFNKIIAVASTALASSKSAFTNATWYIEGQASTGDRDSAEYKGVQIIRKGYERIAIIDFQKTTDWSSLASIAQTEPQDKPAFVINTAGIPNHCPSSITVNPYVRIEKDGRILVGNYYAGMEGMRCCITYLTDTLVS